MEWVQGGPPEAAGDLLQSPTSMTAVVRYAVIACK